MKNWFKKLFIPSGQKSEVVAYNSWIVRWRSGAGSWDFIGYTKEQADIFPSEEDAYKYAEQLRESFKLLRFEGACTNVTVESNQSKMATMRG